MRRYEIERAVLAAPLPGPSVTIMLSLCTRIFKDEGVIPPGQQPSLSRLAADTGYDRSTVMRHLAQLEREGWVIRIRPPAWLARQLHVTTSYAMQIPPEGYPQARGSGHQALGARSGEARRAATRALAAHEAEARRAALRELGDDAAGARGSPPHKPDTTDNRQAEGGELAACDHGTPGGAELNPKTGKPRCPICRRDAGW
jgi:DNA-binding transcriptional ArsR family regulator